VAIFKQVLPRLSHVAIREQFFILSNPSTRNVTSTHINAQTSTLSTADNVLAAQLPVAQ